MDELIRRFGRILVALTRLRPARRSLSRPAPGEEPDYQLLGPGLLFLQKPDTSRTSPTTSTGEQRVRQCPQRVVGGQWLDVADVDCGSADSLLAQSIDERVLVEDRPARSVHQDCCRLSIPVALSERTRGLVGAAELQSMKPSQRAGINDLRARWGGAWPRRPMVRC